MIDRHEVLWSLLRRLEHPNSLRLDLVGQVGLDEVSSECLRGYARESLLEDRQHQQSLMHEFCAGLTQEASAECLVSKFETLDRATDQWRKKRIADLSAVLDAQSISRLEGWAEQQREQGSMGVVRTDYRRLLSGPGAREVLLERALQVCRALKF